jgi:hypothetical protein
MDGGLSMATQEEVQRLSLVRARYRSVPASPVRADDGDGAHLDAVAAYGRDPERILSFSDGAPLAYKTFFTDAYDDVGFLLTMFDRARADNRSLREYLTKERPDLAKDCARHCDDPMFRKFLSEVHDLDVADRERVAVGVRKMLDIKSRSDLNTNPMAAEAWINLRASFNAWRTMP